jgi:hypothetical protein
MPYLQSMLATNLTISFPSWLFGGHTVVGMLIGLVVGFLLACAIR